jgi:hypothetical protein
VPNQSWADACPLLDRPRPVASDNLHPLAQLDNDPETFAWLGIDQASSPIRPALPDEITSTYKTTYEVVLTIVLTMKVDVQGEASPRNSLRPSTHIPNIPLPPQASKASSHTSQSLCAQTPMSSCHRRSTVNRMPATVYSPYTQSMSFLIWK